MNKSIISNLFNINDGISGSLIKQYKNEKNGYPILNIKDEKIVIDGYIKKNIQIKKYKYKKGDIFMLKIGDNVGKVLLLDKNIEIDEFVLSTNLILLSIKEDFLNYNEYLFYYLNSKFYNNFYKSLSNLHIHSYNYTLKTLSIKEIKKIKLFLPEIKELKIITNYYKTLENELELLNKLLIKETKIYKYLLNKLIKFKNLENFTNITTFHRGKVLNNKNYLSNGKIQVLRIKDVINENNNLDKKYINKVENKFLVNNNDIVISLSGNIKNIGSVITNFNGTFTNELHKIKITDDNYSTNFLFFVLKTNKIQNQFIRNAEGSGLMKHSYKTLSKIKIPLINLKEQIKIGKILDSQDCILKNLKQIIELKTKLFQKNL